MECNCNKQKHAYHFNISEVVDGKIREVLNFNFGGHHDLAQLSDCVGEKYNMTPKHAQQLMVGLRLMHHALKKYPDNRLFTEFLGSLNDFKHALKGDK